MNLSLLCVADNLFSWQDVMKFFNQMIDRHPSKPWVAVAPTICHWSVMAVSVFLCRWPSRYHQWWECKFLGEGIIDQGGGFRDSLSDLAEELCPSSSDSPVPLPFFIRTPNQVNNLFQFFSVQLACVAQRSFAVLRSTCSWWVTTYVGKLSTIGHPIRPTQPFIFSGSINE